MYLIGSHGSNLIKSREDSDFDIVFEQGEFAKNINPKIIEKYNIRIDDCSGMNTLEICREYDAYRYSIHGFKLISAIGLCLIKRSHLHKSQNFSKHIGHYHTLKSIVRRDERFEDETYNRLLSERIKLTKEKYPDRTPKLNKTKQEFFDDQVKKYIDHDELHEIVAFYKEPIYKSLQKSNKVWCSKDLWNNLSHEDKIKCVQEEAMVISLERFIIPNIIKNQKHPPQNIAFEWSLNKISTTLTSGWFRDFAIENYFEILSAGKIIPFLEKFKNDGRSIRIN